LDGEPVWLTTEEVDAIHDNQMELYGGLRGVKDLGLVESAVNSPQMSYLYGGERDVLMIALVLCRGIAQNHGYLDGNKRTAAASMLMFLELNGYELVVSDVDHEAPWLGQMVELIAMGALCLPNAYAAFVPYLRELS
jgi:death-on-curing protein